MEKAIQEEGRDMVLVTKLGRTAFLASAARRAEALAPEPLFQTDFDRLFGSSVFDAVMLRTRLPLLAAQAQAGQPSDAPGAAEDMPPWLGIGSSTAYFDLRLREAVAAGTSQVVSLGSGLDCRALRAALPSGALFVEVDDGPLLDFKVQRLADVGLAPYPARLIRGNYLRLDLVDELLRAGVDPGRPVHFLWEANTMYLPPAEARAVLGKLLASFPHCQVHFDYFTEPVAGVSGPKPTGCEETDRELEIVVRAVGDGDWLLVGPWDSQEAQRELGFEVVEDLGLSDVVRLTRGALGEELVQKHRREFEVGLHACQRFCVVRPGAAGASRGRAG